MADIREVFPVLENFVTKEGESLTARSEGQVAEASAKGIMVFPFKDAAGNLQMLTLVDGKLPVTSEGAGVPKSGRAENAAGSLTEVDLASVTLLPNKTYTEIEFVVSSRRDSYFKLVQVDDATTTVLADIVLGPGQYTFQGYAPKREIVAGATGTQVLKVVGKNFEKESAMRASVSCVEMVNA